MFDLLFTMCSFMFVGQITLITGDYDGGVCDRIYQIVTLMKITWGEYSE